MQERGDGMGKVFGVLVIRTCLDLSSGMLSMIVKAMIVCKSDIAGLFICRSKRYIVVVYDGIVPSSDEVSRDVKFQLFLSEARKLGNWQAHASVH